MYTIIQNIFGTYAPITITFLDGSQKAFIDYTYLTGVLLFSITLYSTFRLLGIMFGGKK